MSTVTLAARHLIRATLATSPGVVNKTRTMLLQRCFLWLKVLLPLAAQAQQYSWANLAGQPGLTGSADGAGNAARFGNPHAIAVDNSGNLFVADSSRLRKISPSGTVTTVATSFSRLRGVAVDGSGTAFVAGRCNSFAFRG
jgi:hypothetical protein